MAIHQSKIYRALGGDPKLLDLFCEQMDAGRSARELADWVADNFRAKAQARAERGTDGAIMRTAPGGTDASGVSVITDQNVTDFRQGYFARWRLRRGHLAAMRERAATARQLVREAAAGGASITDAAQLTASAMLTEVMETFDIEGLKASLSGKPEQFLKLVETLSMLARAENSRRENAAKAAKLEVDLKLAGERLISMQEKRALEKHQLKKQIADLQKAVAAGAGGADKRRQMMEAIVATIDAM